MKRRKKALLPAPLTYYLLLWAVQLEKGQLGVSDLSSCTRQYFHKVLIHYKKQPFPHLPAVQSHYSKNQREQYVLSSKVCKFYQNHRGIR